MRIKTERELLNVKVRKQIIDEIIGREEQGRRDDAFKRHQCYRDNTKRYVTESLLAQFEASTVKQMTYAISNVSLVKKIIDKLARVYAYGVDRTVGENKDKTTELQELAKAVELDTKMKLINRYLKLQKNTVMYIKPCEFESKGEMFMGVKLQPLSPHLYSVIEDYNDRERIKAVILSNYEQNVKNSVSTEPAKEGRTYNTPQPKSIGDNKDQAIADEAADENADSRQFIFWSDSLHFTCNVKGEFIDPSTGMVATLLTDEMVENPIEELPFVDFGLDRDGSYWADGGDDLIDGAILVNSLISNLNHIAVTQGYGQMVMTGKNLPNNTLVGPDKVIKLEYEKDEDPAPTVAFLNASAPLSELKAGIEMYVALMLTTNNLSTTGIAMQLQGSGNLASGIALAIDKSESQEDVVDQQQIFLDKEPKVLSKVNKWIEVIKGSPDKDIDPALEDFKLPEDFEDELQVSFKLPMPVVSESEHLDNLKKRKELGISTMVDILKADQPGLTDEQAEAKLLVIMKERLERANAMMGSAINGKDDTQGSDDPAMDGLNDDNKDEDDKA